MTHNPPNQTGDWLDDILAGLTREAGHNNQTNGQNIFKVVKGAKTDEELRGRAKAAIQAKFAEQELWAYQNGESSANADWSFALSEFADIEVDGPMELAAKLKEIEQRHAEEIRAALVDELRHIDGLWYDQYVEDSHEAPIDVKDRLQHLTSQESKE